MEETVFTSYNQSPVREAIFSVTFQPPLAIERVREFCAGSWAAQGYVPAEAEGEANEQPGPLGYVLHTADRSALLRLTTEQLHYHRLGSYPGWEVASAAFLDAWRQLGLEMPEITSQEASIRYINRLGWDLLPEKILDLSEYLNLLPSLPDDFPGTTGPFFLQVQTLDRTQNLHGIITEVAEFTTNASPRIEITLDIRVMYASSKETPIAANLQNFLEVGRVLKNKLFESCITAATRALFA